MSAHTALSMDDGGGAGGAGGAGDSDPTDLAKKVMKIEENLCKKLWNMKLGIPNDTENPRVAWVYNPMFHTIVKPSDVSVDDWEKVEGYSTVEEKVINELESPEHKKFLNRFQGDQHRVLLLGMKPGRNASIQHGIPFCDAPHPTTWMMGTAQSPEFTTWVSDRKGGKPKSGTFFVKALAQNELFGTDPDGQDFFTKKFFVYNYCPVSFLNKDKNYVKISSSHINDDRYLRNETLKEELQPPCDDSLEELIRDLNITYVVAFGKYIQGSVKHVLGSEEVKKGVKCVFLPHPSVPKLKLGAFKKEVKNEMLLVMLSLIEDEVKKLSDVEVTVKEHILLELKGAVNQDMVRSVWLQVNKLVEEDPADVIIIIFIEVF